MAFIRVNRCPVNDADVKDEVIINTKNILFIYADTHKPSRGSWVQLASGEAILICLSFDEIWTFVQRET